jgi:hypothetical protein
MTSPGLTSAFINKLQKFRRSASGNMTLIATISAIPMIASVGLAVDYMRAVRASEALQQVADAAALAAASAKNVTGTQSQQLTQRAAIAKGFITASVANVSDIELVGAPAVTTGPNTIDVKVNAKVKGSFINILNALDSSAEIGEGGGGDQAGSSSRDIDLSVNSKVGFSEDSYRCLLSMHATKNQAVYFGGNSEFMANCAVHANSNDAVAIRTWGSAEAYATSFCARGGWSGSGFSPDPTGGCSWVADPFASMVLPTAGTCLTAAAVGLPSSGSGSKMSTTTGAFVKNQSYTLPPGTYCGGIEGKTHANITLQKGIYILKDGDLKLDAGSEIHATQGTIIYLTGTSSNIFIASGAVFKLVGPNKSNSVVGNSTYPYRGWAIMQDRATTPATDNEISSGGDVDIIGGYYAPTQDLQVTANGDMNADSSYFPMITNTLGMLGTATLYVNLDWDNADLEEPVQLRQKSKVMVTQ